MAIEATSPSVMAIVSNGVSSEATYDKWAFQISTNGFGCAGLGEPSNPPITLSLLLQKFRIRDDGIWELSPATDKTNRVSIYVDDVYRLVAENQAVAQALGALSDAVASYASQLGLL